MNHVEIRIRELGLPADAEPMARHTLADGTPVDLTLDQWRELHAWLDLGQLPRAGADELRRLDEIAP